LLKLAFDSEHKRLGGGDPAPRELDTWLLSTRLHRSLGRTVAKIVADTVRAEESLAHQLEKVATARQHERVLLAKANQIEHDARERGRDEIAKNREYLCAALGIPSDTDQWSLNARITEAAARLSRDGEVKHLRRQIEAIKQALAASQPVREIKGL
jgi:hypothetical protein